MHLEDLHIVETRKLLLRKVQTLWSPLLTVKHEEILVED